MYELTSYFNGNITLQSALVLLIPISIGNKRSQLLGVQQLHHMSDLQGLEKTTALSLANTQLTTLFNNTSKSSRCCIV